MSIPVFIIASCLAQNKYLIDVSKVDIEEGQFFEGGLVQREREYGRHTKISWAFAPSAINRVKENALEKCILIGSVVKSER